MSSEVGEMVAERSSSASKEDEWERKERLETWDCLEYRRGSGGGRESSFLGAIIVGRKGRVACRATSEQAYWGGGSTSVGVRACGRVCVCAGLAWPDGALAQGTRLGDAVGVSARG